MEQDKNLRFFLYSQIMHIMNKVNSERSKKHIDFFLTIW